MTPINDEITSTLQEKVASRTASVSFDQIWEQHAAPKRRPAFRLLSKKTTVAATLVMGLLLWVGYQPVKAYISQFIQVTKITNREKATIGFKWANTVGEEEVAVNSKEEAEKALGLPLPWPHELDRMEGEKELFIYSHGNKPLSYGYQVVAQLHQQRVLFKVNAVYDNASKPELYAKSTEDAVVKEVPVQGGAGKLVTTSEFKQGCLLYFEKGAWQFLIQVFPLGRASDPAVITEKEVIALAESIR